MAQHSTRQHIMAHPGTAQHSTVHHGISAAWHSMTARRSTTQLDKAQHKTAHHGLAQPSTAQRIMA